MNKAQYDNERTVRLRDLLITICQRWRVLILCFVLGAVVLGAISWFKNESDSITTSEKAEAVAESIGSRRAGILQSYAADIKNSTEELIWQSNYNDTALIMGLDPFHLFVHELRYVIGNVETAENSDSMRLALVQAYVAELQEDYLDQKLKVVVDDGAEEKLRELYESPSLIEVSENYQGTGVLKFLFYFASEEDAPAAVSDFKNKMQAVQDIVRKKFGQHELSLAGESSFEYGDLEILQIQEANSQKINDLKDRIARIYDAVKDSRENQYLNYLINYADNNDAGGNLFSRFLRYLNLKMVVAGAALGIVLAALVIILKYLLSDSVKNAKEMEDNYGIPLLGKFNGTQSFYQKRKTRFDKWLRAKKNRMTENSSQDEMEELAVTRVQIEAEKRDLNSIALVIDSSAAQNAALLTNVEKKLDKSFTVRVIKDVFEKPESLKTLAETDGVVLFVQVDSSKNDDIRKTIALCEDYKVQLIGSIVID